MRKNRDADTGKGLGFTLTADWSDAPPCGTACSLCIGHFCPAKGYLGEIPICRSCGEGKACERAIAVVKMQTPLKGDDLPQAMPQSDERRCTECKGILREQSKGPMCWPCTKRHKLIEERISKANLRAAELAMGKVT